MLWKILSQTNTPTNKQTHESHTESGNFSKVLSLNREHEYQTAHHGSKVCSHEVSHWMTFRSDHTVDTRRTERKGRGQILSMKLSNFLLHPSPGNLNYHKDILKTSIYEHRKMLTTYFSVKKEGSESCIKQDSTFFVSLFKLCVCISWKIFCTEWGDS